MNTGIVYLIGAGPGDPGLISVKALDILKRSDCIIYDYLANRNFIEALSCEKIFVGKKGSDHTMPQEEINRLLVAKAKEYGIVARLKGGDPYIFGRGGEEAEALVEAGIGFRIIPGISSFYSAPAYAGIPLTHRDYADAFEVITGHRRDDAEAGGDINLPDYDAKKTFVFLMGVKNLKNISARLISGKNFPADLPAGIVSWGTTPGQKTVTGTLTDISAKAKEGGIEAPAIIILGKVVSLRENLRWFDTLPLFGKRIVVTRTREQASVLSERLREFGADVVEFPTIEIKRKSDLSPLRNALIRIEQYDWIIFTSQNAVGIFFSELRNSGMDARAMHKAGIAAIGPATAEELEKYFIKPDMIPEEYVAEEIIKMMRKSGVSGKRVLLPCAAEARPVLKDGLAALGAVVDRIEIYDTLAPSNISAEAVSAIDTADMITFTSSSTARNFFRIAEKAGASLACIGPVTAETCRELGHEPDVTASEYTIEGLVEAILKYYMP